MPSWHIILKPSFLDALVEGAGRNRSHLSSSRYDWYMWPWEKGAVFRGCLTPGNCCAGFIAQKRAVVLSDCSSGAMFAIQMDSQDHTMHSRISSLRGLGEGSIYFRFLQEYCFISLWWCHKPSDANQIYIWAPAKTSDILEQLHQDIDTWYYHETLRNDRGDTKNDDFWYTCLPDFITNIKSSGTMRDTQKTMTMSATSFRGCNRFSPLLIYIYIYTDYLDYLRFTNCDSP